MIKNIHSNIEQDLELENIIYSRLAELNPEYIQLTDESYKHIGHTGVKERGGRHYRLVIKSAVFKDLSLIKRHQLIYKLLDDLLKQKIHALSIDAK